MSATEGTNGKKALEAAQELAGRHLGFTTLETRNSDDLDFREVAVWNVKQALLDAYHAGYEAGRARR